MNSVKLIVIFSHSCKESDQINYLTNYKHLISLNFNIEKLLCFFRLKKNNILPISFSLVLVF